jgi:hypothetical protein
MMAVTRAEAVLAAQKGETALAIGMFEQLLVQSSDPCLPLPSTHLVAELHEMLAQCYLVEVGKHFSESVTG